MKNDHADLAHLIHACLDERASDAQVCELNARLRADAKARDLYLQLADTHSCLAVDESLWTQGERLGGPVIEHRASRKSVGAWRQMAAAAIGIVLGMLCTSVVFAYVAPALGKAKMVLLEDFESNATSTPGLPRETGQWGGDEALVVTGAREVKPRSGRRMLRFVSATYPGENSPRSQWSDVYRIVDVRGQVSSGNTLARLSASFSQDSVAGREQFSCSVEAFSLDEDLGVLPAPLSHAWIRQNNSAAGSRRMALSASREWQDLSVEVPVTPRTQFVLVHLAVIQNAPSIEAGAVQFPGQYVDDVKLELVSRP